MYYKQIDGEEKRGMSKNAKLGIIVLVELITIVILGICLVKAYAHSKYSLVDVNELDKKVIEVNEGANADMAGYTSIALFGIDARDSSLGAGNRSDSIMVICINDSTREVRIASVYRDTLLEIEDEDRYTNKINAAYAFGGPELAIKSLNTNLDLNISEYISVNWEGLTRAIDALGGVDVHVEEDELEVLNEALTEQIAVNGIYSDGVFTTGDLTLNGAQATAYARIRSTGQGDITRTERQREVLNSMMVKMKSAGFSGLNNMINELFPYISTSISEKQMISYAKKISDYEVTKTTGFPIRFTFYDSDYKGSCIAADNLTENVSALQKFLFGTDNYVPSAKVQEINSKLTDETGIYGSGPIESEPAEQDSPGSSDGSGESE